MGFGLAKDLTKNFLPGLVLEHVVGLEGVGVHVITATITAFTAQTDAQLLIAPPNTDAINKPSGVIVHSLGTTPSGFFASPVQSNSQTGPVQIQKVTMDNSAIYVRAIAHSYGAVRGQAFEFVIMR